MATASRFSRSAITASSEEGSGIGWDGNGDATSFHSTDKLEAQIARASTMNPISRLLDQIPAFGPLIALAMVAFHQGPDPLDIVKPADQNPHPTSRA